VVAWRESSFNLLASQALIAFVIFAAGRLNISKNARGVKVLFAAPVLLC